MQSNHDLIQLLHDDIADDDINDFPNSMVNNACDYYQPNEVRQLLDHEKNSINLLSELSGLESTLGCIWQFN